MNRALIEAALAGSRRTTENLEAILAGYDEQAKGSPTLPFKKTNGRLTERGIRELRTMVDAGRSDGEIAKTLGITQPAAYNQRQNYLVEKLSPKRRK